MGIHNFYNWLNKEYYNCFIDYSYYEKVKSSYLCIDLNSIIYKCYEEYHDVDLPDDNKYAIINNNIINVIKNYIKIFNPTKKIIISIDGVSPLLKQKHSKKRRFLKNNKNYSNIISPGTEYMKSLKIKLTNEFTDSNIILSTYEENGEGEHKIFKLLNSNVNKYDKVYIISNDTDLILLSYKYYCYIYVVFDIHNVFDVYTWKDNIRINYNDLILIMCLFGNDYILKHPILTIIYDLKNVFFIYNEYYTITNKNIFENNKINIENFAIFLKILNNYESTNLYKYKHLITYACCNIDKNANIEDFIKDKKEIMKNKISINNNIIPNEEFIQQYYSCRIHNMDDIDNMTERYLQSIQWCIMYYKNNIPYLWVWDYKYNCSPFINTVYNLLNKEIIDKSLYIIPKMEYNETEFIPSITEQLLYTLNKDYLQEYKDFVKKFNSNFENVKIDIIYINGYLTYNLIINYINYKDIKLYLLNI